MVSEISRAEIAKTENFQLLNHGSDQRMLEVWPPQKWGFWCQRRFWSPKKVIGGPKKWKKLFFSKTAHPTIYLKSNMSSVNLMGTSCSGICLGHWLLIFWFTRRAVCRHWGWRRRHQVLNCYFCIFITYFDILVKKISQNIWFSLFYLTLETIGHVYLSRLYTVIYTS